MGREWGRALVRREAVAGRGTVARRAMARSPRWPVGGRARASSGPLYTILQDTRHHL